MENHSSNRRDRIGSIKIKMYDGIVRTLTKVRYVVDIKRNFISLGILDYVDNKYKGQGGVLKVSKGVLIVMKEKIWKYLYVARKYINR